MHNDREPFDRAQIRHAIARAIDRELLVRTLFAGHAAVADWLLPPGHWATAPDLPRLRYDVASARAALAGERGVTLLTSTDRLRVTVAPRDFAQMLGDAGLPTRVVSLELGVLLGRLDAGDFDLAVLQLPEVTEPNLLAWFFHPRGIPGAGGQGRNRARYRSVRAAELLDLGGANPDREVRRRAYVALAHEMLRDLPSCRCGTRSSSRCSRRGRAEFSPSAEGRWLSLCDL
jgi:peptide/nickel transport system substrate-binding protein